MKLSIIVAVLNSHEVVRRHILFWEKMGGLPKDVEVLFMDNGSDPPLSFPNHNLGENFHIIPTYDYREWNVEPARNMGAKLAKGEFLLMTDIDYVINEDAMMAAFTLKEDKAGFHREFGVIDEEGNFTQDFDELRKYGLLESRIQERGTKMPPHPNNFIMKKEIFWKLGGYREDVVGKTYPNKGDTYWKRTWSEALEKGIVTIQDANLRKTLYMFPNGQFCGDVDYNPFNLFHNLTRKTEQNHWYQKSIGNMK